LIGAVARRELLRRIPASELWIVSPVMAASILVYREKKSAGVIELLKRSFDYRRI
jgi:hypothetical protein